MIVYNMASLENRATFNNKKFTTMKRLLLLSLILAGVLVTTTGHAQVIVRGHVGFGIPVPRVFIPPIPVPTPVYSDPYAVPYYPQRDYERVVPYYGRAYDRYHYNVYPRYERSYGNRYDYGWKHRRKW